VSALVRGTKYDPPRGQVAFEKAVIEAVDFRGTSWDDFSATNSLFVECDFREARFAHAVLGSRKGQTRYVRCVFDQSDLRVADPGTARFEACQFEEAKIEGWLISFGVCRLSLRRTNGWCDFLWAAMGAGCRARYTETVDERVPRQ
jgi:uncharacterized protein YjbI with pentapeptide repeats